MADDLEQADAVALLLAHVRGQEDVVEAMLGMHEDRAAMFAATVGLLLMLLEQAGVNAAAVENTLTDWQERRRGSL
jgi:hypothetical protein